MYELLGTIFSAIIVGFFGIVMWKLNQIEAKRKESLQKRTEQDEKIEFLIAQIQEISEKVGNLTDVVNELRVCSDGNSEGVKFNLRYMLQRYHAIYTLRGYITSNERREFLEGYEVYTEKGGNGTAQGWDKDIEALPIRDDLVTPNPYLEILKKEMNGCE